MKKTTVIIISIILSVNFLINAQSINLKLGLFIPSLNSDLWEINQENLAFSQDEMMEIYYGIEYEFFLGKYFSFTFEGNHYSKNIYTQYSDFTYEDNSPILQNFSLRISGLEIGFKLYPIGHRQTFFPFIGAGGGIYAWKYEQWGDFIDFVEDTVITDSYAYSKSYSPGVFAKAGVVFRFRRSFGISIETRYLYLKGNLSSLFEGFESLDLSGISFNMGLNIYIW
jgi:hypothetical protein